MTDIPAMNQRYKDRATLLGLSDREAQIADAAMRVERERCAQIAETFPDDILVFVERPGGPPGNYYRKSTKQDIADAIRSQKE